MKHFQVSVLEWLALLIFIPLSGVVALLFIFYYLRPRPNKWFPTHEQ